MVKKSMDVVAWLRKHLEEADPDLLRAMVSAFVDALMGAEVEEICNAALNERTPDRENSRNGYRTRAWDTRAGSIELRIPMLRSASFRTGSSSRGGAPNRRSSRSSPTAPSPRCRPGASTGSSRRSASTES
jgi:hypothetical protein